MRNALLLEILKKQRFFLKIGKTVKK